MNYLKTTKSGKKHGMSIMTELNQERVHECFIIEAYTKRKMKSDYLILTFGFIGFPDDGTLSVRIGPDVRQSIVYKMMVDTGYKEDGKKQPDILKHFERGMHFFAKPVKKYYGGDPNTVRWTINIDTLTARKQDVDIPQEKLERIQLIVSKSPNFDEAIRRMGTSDASLVFTFGYAVGSGLMNREGKL